MKEQINKIPNITETPKIINIGLKRDLKEILAFPENIDRIFQGIGNVTDYSIEIWFKEPTSFSSYVYYENKTRMLADYQNLLKLIEDAKSNNQVPSF